MTVHVRLFAILRERAGRDSVELELPDPATVADAFAALAELPGLESLPRLGVRMAVNREYAGADTLIHAADELALIPPVSGGAGLWLGTTERSAPIHAAIQDAPLSLDAMLARVADPAAGAVVSFQGMPRDIAVLDYEAYGEMALERITAILAECREAHGLCRAAAAHRVGSVPALEASIVVAVSAPHRGEAFAGAREILDRIKSEAPIWKVEVDAEGRRRPVEGVVPE